MLTTQAYSQMFLLISLLFCSSGCASEPEDVNFKFEQYPPSSQATEVTANTTPELLALTTGSTVSESSPQSTFVAVSGRHCDVAIDVGHTKEHAGATSARGTEEYSFNWRFANELVTALSRSQSINSAFLIDPKEEGIKLQKRSPVAASLGADLLLSIHHDSVQPHYLIHSPTDGKGNAWCDRFRGHSLFVSLQGDNAEGSTRLGRTIGAALKEAGRVPTTHHSEPIKGEGRSWVDEKLGLHRYDQLAVLRTATIPTVLFEVGVIVHPEEERELNNSNNRHELINAIVNGVVRFCDTTSDPQSHGAK
jgi:N-acetylmuramoyl-L-alanine amidase